MKRYFHASMRVKSACERVVCKRKVRRELAAVGFQAMDAICKVQIPKTGTLPNRIIGVVSRAIGGCETGREARGRELQGLKPFSFPSFDVAR
jgi:hypothetical protein